MHVAVVQRIVLRGVVAATAIVFISRIVLECLEVIPVISEHLSPPATARGDGQKEHGDEQREGEGKKQDIIAGPRDRAWKRKKMLRLVHMSQKDNSVHLKAR